MPANLSPEVLQAASERIRILSIDPKANYIFWPAVRVVLDQNGWDKADVMDCLRECTAVEFELFATNQRYRVTGQLTEDYGCEIVISVFELEMTIEVIHLNAT
ncbi:MAG: hypothetical protein H0U98_09540 [Alphaproteobacteria bacterium]|nr:hypothetical protein [Alphaproteobacteria bacterium]